jgi:hypothetical protein
MGLFNRMLGIKPQSEEPKTDEDKFVEQIADDINTEFEKWIKPILAKIIGKENTEKIADADFEAVLASQAHRLFLEHGTTIKGNTAIFNFKLCQVDHRDPTKRKVLSKFRYEMNLEDESSGL